MKIISWNMARAIRPKGMDTDPWTVLETLNPDIALLQEAKVPPSTFGGHFHMVNTNRGWGTAIWSKYPFSWTGNFPNGSESLNEKIKEALAGYVASAVIGLSSSCSLSVTSVHAYPAAVKKQYLEDFPIESVKLPSESNVWPGDLIWWSTRFLPSEGGSFILGGDWNTSLLFDKVYGPRGNAEFFARMRDTGWYTAMKKFHETEVQTYYSPGKGPYQLDHVFLTSDLYDGLKTAEVLPTPKVLSTSDHAPIVLEIMV